MNMKEQVLRAHGLEPKIHWECRCVLDKGTEEFTKELQEKLNELSEAGFGIAQFMFRDEGKSVVLVGQKTVMPTPEELENAGIELHGPPYLHKPDPSRHN